MTYLMLYTYGTDQISKYYTSAVSCFPYIYSSHAFLTSVLAPQLLEKTGGEKGAPVHSVQIIICT